LARLSRLQRSGRAGHSDTSNGGSIRTAAATTGGDAEKYRTGNYKYERAQTFPQESI
jgi:hypothetical protein